MAKVERGEANPVEVKLKVLVDEVRETGELRVWSEKMSKLLRLARLKVGMLVKILLQLEKKGSTFSMVSPLLIPWIDFRDVEEALTSLLELISRRKSVNLDVEDLTIERKSVLELRLMEERKYKEDVLRRVAELGRVSLEGLLEGGILKRISIFVEVLRLISEGLLKYDKVTGEVYVERV